MEVFSQKPYWIGDIPIYVHDVEAYISESFYLYNEILNNHRLEIERLERLNKSKYTLSRKEAIRDIISGMKKNLESLIDIRRILLPHASLEGYSNIQPNPNDNLKSYLKDYHYLRRDWSHSKKSEQQLKIIHDSISKALWKVGFDNNNSLFFGAGVCRIACDLSDLFQVVYATDKSFSMAYHYHKIIKEDFSFFEILYKNISSHLNSAVEIKVGLDPENSVKSISNSRKTEKNYYFISDVLHLPIKDNSIYNLFSIYFSDVIALKLWMPEIKRVLKKGGLFIHFGPLDYFFEDMGEMYSAEEVVEIFKKNNFSIEVNDWVDTMHLPSENALSNKVYTNWLLVCSYEGSEQNEIQLEKSDIIEVNYPIDYNIKGVIENNEYSYETTIQMPNGDIYQGAETVLEILKLVDGKRSISEIINELTKIFGSIKQNEIDQLLRILKTLIQKRLIKKL